MCQSYNEKDTGCNTTETLQFIAKNHGLIGDYENIFTDQEQHYMKLLTSKNYKNKHSFRESDLKPNLLLQKKTLDQKNSQQTVLVNLLGTGLLMIPCFYSTCWVKKTSNLKLGKAKKNLQPKNKQNKRLLKVNYLRVKNNLALVKILLALRTAQLINATFNHAIGTGQNSFQFKRIVHQKRHQRNNIGSIAMKIYFLNLGEGISDPFDFCTKIKIAWARHPLKLDVDRPKPIGLSVNEVLTKASKYAFLKDTRDKTIRCLALATPNILSLQTLDKGKEKIVGLIAKETAFCAQFALLRTQPFFGKKHEKKQNYTSILFEFNSKTAA